MEGVIVEVNGNEVTAESNRGRRIAVMVTDRTRIKLDEDFPGRLSDLQIGTEVEIKFDPDSLVAFKIEIEDAEAEIKGTIVQVLDREVTIESKNGRQVTLSVSDGTRFEFDEGFPGSLNDLEIGAEVEIKFDPGTNNALRIKLED